MRVKWNRGLDGGTQRQRPGQDTQPQEFDIISTNIAEDDDKNSVPGLPNQSAGFFNLFRIKRHGSTRKSEDGHSVCSVSSEVAPVPFQRRVSLPARLIRRRVPPPPPAGSLERHGSVRVTNAEHLPKKTATANGDDSLTHGRSAKSYTSMNSNISIENQSRVDTSIPILTKSASLTECQPTSSTSANTFPNFSHSIKSLSPATTAEKHNLLDAAKCFFSSRAKSFSKRSSANVNLKRSISTSDAHDTKDSPVSVRSSRGSTADVHGSPNRVVNKVNEFFSRLTSRSTDEYVGGEVPRSDRDILRSHQGEYHIHGSAHLRRLQVSDNSSLFCNEKQENGAMALCKQKDIYAFSNSENDFYKKHSARHVQSMRQTDEEYDNVPALPAYGTTRNVFASCDIRVPDVTDEGTTHHALNVQQTTSNFSDVARQRRRSDFKSEVSERRGLSAVISNNTDPFSAICVPTSYGTSFKISPTTDVPISRSDYVNNECVTPKEDKLQVERVNNDLRENVDSQILFENHLFSPKISDDIPQPYEEFVNFALEESCADQSHSINFPTQSDQNGYVDDISENGPSRTDILFSYNEQNHILNGRGAGDNNSTISALNESLRSIVECLEKIDHQSEQSYDNNEDFMTVILNSNSGNVPGHDNDDTGCKVTQLNEDSSEYVRDAIEHHDLLNPACCALLSCGGNILQKEKWSLEDSLSLNGNQTLIENNNEGSCTIVNRGSERVGVADTLGCSGDDAVSEEGRKEGKTVLHDGQASVAEGQPRSADSLTTPCCIEVSQNVVSSQEQCDSGLKACDSRDYSRENGTHPRRGVCDDDVKTMMPTVEVCREIQESPVPNCLGNKSIISLEGGEQIAEWLDVPHKWEINDQDAIPTEKRDDGELPNECSRLEGEEPCTNCNVVNTKDSAVEHYVDDSTVKTDDITLSAVSDLQEDVALFYKACNEIENFTRIAVETIEAEDKFYANKTTVHTRSNDNNHKAPEFNNLKTIEKCDENRTEGSKLIRSNTVILSSKKVPLDSDTNTSDVSGYKEKTEKSAKSPSNSCQNMHPSANVPADKTNSIAETAKSLNCIPCTVASTVSNDSNLTTKCKSEEHLPKTTSSSSSKLPVAKAKIDKCDSDKVKKVSKKTVIHKNKPLDLSLLPSVLQVRRCSTSALGVPNTADGCVRSGSVAPKSPEALGQVRCPSALGIYSDTSLSPTSKVAPKGKSRIPKKQGSTPRPLVAPRPVRPPMWLSKAELSQEIQHLSGLCETRTKELNRLKLETKHATSGFDALAVVIRYMTSEMNAFNNPQLATDLKNAQDHLNKGKQDLEYYEKEIDKLNLQHVQEVNVISQKLSKEHDVKVQELTSKQNEQTKLLNEQHEKEAKSLMEALKASCDEERQQHAKMLDDLQQELRKQRQEMEIFHQHELDDLERRHIEKQNNLLTEVEKLQKQCEEAKQLSVTMEDALQKDTDSKLQWLSTKKLDLKKEVDSLKAVLEIKNNELHSLRKENLEMQKELEDLPLARERIKMLQARAEDLQALMAEKVRLERQLSTEHQTMKEIYEREEKVNKRLSMENEELLWRLKQNSESSLLSISIQDETETEVIAETTDLSMSCPPSAFDEPSSPVKSPRPLECSKPRFFTYMNQDELKSMSPQSPRTQYKGIQPHRSPAKPITTSSARSSRKSSPHYGEGTPRKVARQVSKNSRERRSSSTDTNPEESSSVIHPKRGDISSDSSIRHQNNLQFQTSSSLSKDSNGKWPEGTDDAVLVVNEHEDLCADIDPKTYYHMTFPVKDSIQDAETEDSVKVQREASLEQLKFENTMDD